MAGRDTPEGRLKQFIIDSLNGLIHQGEPLYFWATWDTQAGIPDIVGAWRSLPLVIELKAEKTALTNRQALTLHAWRKAAPKGIVGVLRALEISEPTKLLWAVGGLGSVKLDRLSWWEQLTRIYAG